MKNTNRYLPKAHLLKASMFLILSTSSALEAKTSAIEAPMVIIPAGEFIMGNNHKDASKREQPAHTVNISSFKMGKYEVTKKEYAQFIKATGHKTGDICVSWDRPAEGKTEANIRFGRGVWSDTTHGATDYHPVLCVSPEDAKAYTQWLSQETGKNYRLPTESEWEYASRAGTTTMYYSGNNVEDLCQYGNVFDLSGQAKFKKFYGIEESYAPCDDQAEFTTVVGMYQPNAFGLYDTMGNVNEIVADCEHNSYNGAPKDGVAWTTDCDLFHGNKMSIHRGGAYGAWSDPKSQRSTRRGHIGPKLRSSLGEGFRLALELPKKIDTHQPESTIEFVKGLAVIQQQETERRAKLTLISTAINNNQSSIKSD